jgi:hypothetical protein
MQCHQGVRFPTAQELREERRMLQESGKVPPMELPRIRPTMKGRDFRWHETLQKYVPSTCWECHGRHMIQYEFGQPFGSDFPGASDLNDEIGLEKRPGIRSVYHKVFRMRGDRAFERVSTPGGAAAEGLLPCGIHFGCADATLRREGGDSSAASPVHCTDIVQRHRRILSEEGGKFIGRHVVLIDWIAGACRSPGETLAAGQDGTSSNGTKTAQAGGEDKARPRRVIAREERQLTVKNMRARYGSLPLWIDFVSRLESTGGVLLPAPPHGSHGFRFVPPVDAGTTPEYRESDHWRAITFVYLGTTYTAACFDHPDNPRPPSARSPRRAPIHQIGYGLAAQIDRGNPLVFHYRLWVQGGRMSSEDIRSMSADFLHPIEIEVEPGGES